jgi:hypothetical protein
MLQVLRKIIRGARSRGVRYFIYAIPNELANPRHAITMKIRRAIIALQKMPYKPRPAARGWTCRNLQFFYDLSVAPLTFDFATCLAAAEVERRIRRLDGIDIVIVMGSHNGTRREFPEYDALVDATARLWRLRNLVQPMVALMPTVVSMAICGTRSHAQSLMTAESRSIYPDGYSVFLPRQPSMKILHDHARNGIQIWPLLQATEGGRRFIAAFMERKVGGRRSIIITLRSYDYTPNRNSQSEAWLKFADSLDKSLYAPIFVFDTETAMRPLLADFSQHIVCEAASWNMEIRMALYEVAWLNMALMHGPLELCWFNEASRYLIFLPVGVSAVQEPEALAENGHVIGEDHYFAKPWQHIVWEADDADILCQEFQSMVNRLGDIA